MGNQSVSDEKFGKIEIWTQKKHYIAGEQVNGSINVNLIKDFPSNQLYLIIEGKEKAKVVYSYQGKFSIFEYYKKILTQNSSWP